VQQSVSYCVLVDVTFVMLTHVLVCLCYRSAMLSPTTPREGPRFSPRLVHEEFVVDKVALGHYQSFYLLTYAQENCFKKNIKIYMKTAPTRFGLIAIIREFIIRSC